jgi:hypothetical protein
LDTNAEWPVFGSISIPHAVPRQCGDELQSLIWQVWAPSRAKFFVWLIVQNRVWTVDRLLQRQWPNECFCLLCIRNLETATHLLRDCEFSKLVWSQISEWASLPGFHPCRWREDCRMVSWYGDLSGSLPTEKAKGAKSRTVLVCWMLWCERNRRIFEGVERCPDQITAMIQADAWQRILAGATKLRCIVAHRFSE